MRPRQVEAPVYLSKQVAQKTGALAGTDHSRANGCLGMSLVVEDQVDLRMYASLFPAFLLEHVSEFLWTCTEASFNPSKLGLAELN